MDFVLATDFVDVNCERRNLLTASGTFYFIKIPLHDYQSRMEAIITFLREQIAISNFDVSIALLRIN